VFLPVDMARYARESERIMAILADVTPLVEPLSLDEAFLDVTGSTRLLGPGREIARRVKTRIRGEVGLTASAGVAENKFLAKVASDLEKPDGLVEVPPGQGRRFLAPLPVARLWGVGPATAETLAALGIRTIGDLAVMSPGVVRSRLGSSGLHFLALARGEDDRPVVPWHEAKSVGAEETFGRDTGDVALLRATLLGQAERVAAELRMGRLWGRTVTLKLRLADFRTLTRRDTSDPPTADAGDIFRRAWGAFTRVERRQPVRLIGLSVSGLERRGQAEQLPLFGRPAADRAERIGRVTDELQARFGPRALRRASMLESRR
jgi:DNA polymerase-4